MSASVITFRPEYRGVFRELNLEWITKYFRVEKKDVEQVESPETCLKDGGEVFFVVVGGEAVGTCAMYRIGEGRYELAKMAVRPDCHGRGFGDLLMLEAERWARSRAAREILILSNTVLEPAIRLYKKHAYKTIRLGPHPDYERCNIEMLKVLD
jgi:GNAT superfamily N-acetyltransferase